MVDRSIIMSALWRSDIESHHCDIDKGPMILAACATMTGLACMVLVARIYTRGWMTHSTDRDDYTMWVAVALSVTAFAILIPQIQSGTGRYGSCLAREDLQRSLMLQFISQPLYVWSILLVKVSIVFCLLRFTPSNAFSRFLWSLMVFFIITASIYFVTEMLQCRPLNVVWNPSVKGICFSPLAIRAASYANNSISLTVDLLLATLPIAMIWKVQVDMHVKAAIGFVMSLGALAAAACAIRIHYLSPSTLTGDALFDSIPWTIWTAVECNIAIIAASVPSTIPLLKKFHALGKCTTKSAQGRSQAATQEIEQGDERQFSTDTGKLEKNSMQEGLLIDWNKDVTKRDMIPQIRIDNEEVSPPDSDDNEDISQMYASASRSISKRTTPPSSIRGEQSTSTSYSGPIVGGRMGAD